MKASYCYVTTELSIVSTGKRIEMSLPFFGLADRLNSPIIDFLPVHANPHSSRNSPRYSVQPSPVLTHRVTWIARAEVPFDEVRSMELTFAIRLCSALLCGVVIGFERERRERAAGLRTHTLVAMSSALIMLVSGYSFADIVSAGTVTLDPSRIAAQAVSGIGFLGAGVIIFRKNTVSGLTTAASIWSAAAVGLACGGGLFGPALMGTFGILFIQVVLRSFEYRFFSHNHPSVLSLRIRRDCGGVAAVERAVIESGVELRGMRLRPGKGNSEDRIELVLGNAREAVALRLVERLGALEGTGSVMYQGLRQRLPRMEGQDTDREEERGNA